VERLSDYGADYRNFNRELLLHFREILLLKVAGEASRLTAFILPDEKEKMRPLLAAFSEEDLLRTFEVLTKVETDLRWTQDPRVTLELALLKIAQMPRLLPFAELVGRVERLASGQPQVARPAAPPAPPIPKKFAAPAEPKVPAPADAKPAREKAPEGDIVSAMEALAQSRPTLAQSLRGASAREKDGTLVLEVRADFLALAVLHAEDHRELARQALGRSVKIEIVAATPEGSAPGAESEEAARRRLIDEAARQPAIQEVLDLFGGAVVEVRQNES